MCSMQLQTNCYRSTIKQYLRSTLIQHITQYGTHLQMNNYRSTIKQYLRSTIIKHINFHSHYQL